jgi:hypothetical protein
VLVTLAALESLGRHLSGIPGRKNLVWITGGIPMTVIVGTGLGPAGDVIPFGSILGETSNRLAQAGVALYIGDARGVRAPEQGRMTVDSSVRGTNDIIRMHERGNNDPRLAMNLMAGITGGRVFTTNDNTDGLKQTKVDELGSYTVGFYSPEVGDGKWHKIRLGCKRPGVTLHYREGYLAENTHATFTQWTQEQWAEVVRNPLGNTNLPLLARAQRVPENGAVTLEVLVDPTAVHFRREGDTLTGNMDICVAELTTEGKASVRVESTSFKLDAQNWAEVYKGGMPYARTWQIAPSTVKLKVVVRDRNTGLLGSLEIPVKEL